MTELVMLALGMMVCGVFAYAIWAWRSTRVAGAEIQTLKASAELVARANDGLASRVKRVEDALRIDGARAMQEAAKGNLPAFMK